MEPESFSNCENNPKITEVEGDLFGAPEGSVLIHACNCVGSWGAGIAKAFARQYPTAFRVYNAHCRSHIRDPHDTTLTNSVSGEDFIAPLPLGTALIIPPQEDDYAGRRGGKRHWIVCLFTSYGFGSRVASRPQIVEHTVHAVRDLRRQLAQLLEDGEDVSQVYSCRFNSGLFNVPWTESRAVLQQELQGMPGVEEVIVVRPEGEEE